MFYIQTAKFSSLSFCLKQPIRIRHMFTQVDFYIPHAQITHGFFKKSTNKRVELKQLLGRFLRYFKEPDVFKPERWESECNNLPNYALFGFGGGPRSCIGKNLSLMESKIALIKLLKRYSKIRLPEEKRVMLQKIMYEPVARKITFTKQIKEASK